MPFPESFLFGVATSAYQIEGAVDEDGRGRSIWDTFCRVPGAVAGGESGSMADDHYHRWAEDIDLMAGLGVQAYRFSVAWPRLFPDGGTEREPRGFAFYDRLIDSLLARGIEPFLTLYHWDLPQALQDKGGWASREVLARFADYAGAVAEAFGDRVRSFAPINEPWVVAWLGYGLGVHAPGISDVRGAIAAAHHTVVAHARAAEAIRAERPDASVGPVLNQSLPDVDDISDPFQMQAARAFDATMNTFWMEALLRGQYPAEVWDTYGRGLEDVVRDGDLEPVVNDWLGINYYFNARIGHEVPPGHPTRVRVIDEVAGINAEGRSLGQVTDMGWQVTPQGIGDLVMRWTREYGDDLPPLYITENGMASADVLTPEGAVHDRQRIDYLNDHLLSLRSAIERGADVRGYFQWSFLDNFEWAMGYAKRFGIVHVDYATQRRTAKDSALWYREVIRTGGAALMERDTPPVA